MANENFKKTLRGYYNYTPPETLSGERLPHYLDDAFSRKDQFGHGSPQPIVDMKEIMKKAGEILDEVYASGQINQDEFKQLYSAVQQEAMKMEDKPKGLLNRFKDWKNNYEEKSFNKFKENNPAPEGWWNQFSER